MITIKDYSLTCTNKKILDKINLHIPSNAFYCLIGESGAGKTMLGRAVLGMLPSNFQSTGEIISNQKDMEIILQDPINSLQPNIKIKKQLQHLLKSNGEKNTDLQNSKINSALSSVGFVEPDQILQLCPFELSGGMCQKVAIAVTLLMNSKIIIADEPTSALDSESQNNILSLLENLYHEKNLTILFITHDLNIVKNYATHVGIMNQGRLIEAGCSRKILKAPAENYTKELINIFENNY